MKIAINLIPFSTVSGIEIFSKNIVSSLLKLKENETLSDERVQKLKANIKIGATPRHVPRFVVEVKGIPYTRSGKKMELAVQRLINHRELTNIEAVANPECLSEYSKMTF